MPCVVDLAAMRDAMTKLGGDAQKINPQVPVHLVIDHSRDGRRASARRPAFAGECRARICPQHGALRVPELGLQGARQFQGRAAGHRHLPPGQSRESRADGVDLERRRTGAMVAYPDTLVGTDSHTTMVNGLGVLGWGVGGIEAEAAMLGQPVSMLIPEVVGFKLTGTLVEGITATDLVLTVTQMLRAKGVVGRFVEFYGAGPRCAQPRRPRDDRQHGAGIWRDLRLLPDRRGDAQLSAPHRPRRRADRAGRGLCQGAGHVARRRRARPGVHRHAGARHGDGPAVARRPEAARRTACCSATSTTISTPSSPPATRSRAPATSASRSTARDHDIGHGDVVIAAITSCTNTSNPSVLVAAGLVARKARALGLKPKPWVKTSLAPGSQVVTDYLDQVQAAGRSRRDRLQPGRLWLHHLHRQFRPAAPRRSARRSTSNDLVAASVLLGQPQLRGPRLARRARQLPRLAAAGRRLCAEGHGARRHHHRPDRQGDATASRST